MLKRHVYKHITQYMPVQLFLMLDYHSAFEMLVKAPGLLPQIQMYISTHPCKSRTTLESR